MESETRKVLSQDFERCFKVFKEENKHKWDAAACVLALVHWTTYENGYVLIIPTRGSPSTAVDCMTDQIQTKEDGSRVGVFTYVHKETGLKKIFEFHETSEPKLILVWKDNSTEQGSMAFYDWNLNIHSLVVDQNGDTPARVFRLSVIWKLTTMVNAGLISERHKKKAFIMTAEAASRYAYGKNYFSQLIRPDLTNYLVPTDLEYLDRCWALDPLTSSLRFVATHIHRVLVNGYSTFKLRIREEGPTKASIETQPNGARVLEASYDRTRFDAVTNLRIVESNGTGGGITIKFGTQMLKVDTQEYVRNGEFEEANLYKLSAKIRVHLICENGTDKLKELLSSYMSAVTPYEKSFMRNLLIQVKPTLGVQVPVFLWQDKLLHINSVDTFKESTILNLLLAECIIRENGIGMYEMLTKAWGVETLRAIHVVAACVHLAMISHPKNIRLRTTTGADNVQRIVASSDELVGSAGTRVLEAEYQIPETGMIKKLVISEGVKNRLFCAALGGTWVPLLLADLVCGHEWKINTDNQWNRVQLTNELNEVLAGLDSMNSGENPGQ